ncbi:MAG: hypothetical protein IJT01_04625 [Selenomonadaceae bacterium]|nr:hypothetical protein [Selenomonadaceae bacterium]
MRATNEWQERWLRQALLIHDALQDHAGRTLRVLGIGSGTLPCLRSLEERGAETACLHLKAQTDRAEVLSRMEDRKGDLAIFLATDVSMEALGGTEQGKEFFVQLADHADCLLFAVPDTGEAACRGRLLLADAYTLLSCFDFVRLLSFQQDGRGAVLLGSRRYVLLNGTGILPITQTLRETNNVFHDAHAGSRQYFFCEELFVKGFRFLGEGEPYAHNREEFGAEARFLQEMGGQDGYPRLYSLEQNPAEGWIARERLDGRLLSARKQGDPYDPWGILRQILEQLIVLEQKGWYCADLRITNVLEDNGRVRLIDYGGFWKERSAYHWPHEPVLSFLIFMDEVLRMDVRFFPIRRTRMLTSLFSVLPSHVVEEIADMPMVGCVFARLHRILFGDRKSEDTELRLRTVESMALETALDGVVDELWDCKKEIRALQEKLQEMTARVQALERQGNHRKESF